jgi:hypothetical protein
VGILLLVFLPGTAAKLGGKSWLLLIQVMRWWGLLGVLLKLIVTEVMLVLDRWGLVLDVVMLGWLLQVLLGMGELAAAETTTFYRRCMHQGIESDECRSLAGGWLRGVCKGVGPGTVQGVVEVGGGRGRGGGWRGWLAGVGRGRAGVVGDVVNGLLVVAEEGGDVETARHARSEGRVVGIKGRDSRQAIGHHKTKQLLSMIILILSLQLYNRTLRHFPHGCPRRDARENTAPKSHRPFVSSASTVSRSSIGPFQTEVQSSSRCF